MMPSFDQIHQCAPNVTPATIAAIIQVESGGDAWALGVNGPVHGKPHPHSAPEAARIARHYISLGYSVDLGLMQINSRNLKRLGYSIEDILNPCTNLKAGSLLLSRGYAGAIKRYGDGQDALKAALSAYNTGNYEKGFRNGYVAKYFPTSSPAHITVSATYPHPKTIISRGSGFPVNVITDETDAYMSPKPVRARVILHSTKMLASTKPITREATLPVDPVNDETYFPDINR